MKKKKILYSVIAILIVIILPVAVYSVIFFTGGESHNNILEEMSNSTVYENTDSVKIVQSNAFGSFARHHIYSLYAVESPDNKDVSEMFLTESKGFFNKGAFERYNIIGHYTTNDPVGMEIVEGKNKNNETAKFLLVYSANPKGIAKIVVELKDSETQQTQTVDALSVILSGAFASQVELDSPNMTVQHLICYDEHGEIVYEYKI